MSRDYYAVLGLTRKASPDEIKQAYRKLARKLHPDVNPGDSAAEERFKEISAAFDVLGDSKKRALYDEFGEDGLRPGFNPDRARTYADWQRRTEASEAFRRGTATREDPFAAGGFNLGDLFGDMADFGVRDANRRGSDVQTEMSIPFRDAVLGVERELRFSRPTSCESCRGTGAAGSGPPQTCQTCGGTGHRSVAQGPISFRATCPTCRGTGQQPGPPCTRCHGTGHMETPTRLKVRVPPGIDDGQTIRLAGQGLPGSGQGPSGDLFIRVHVQSHPQLRRQDRDLYLDVPVTVREAMVGATIDVPTLTGGVKLTIPPGVQSGTKLRLKGRGVPASASRPAGNLYVVLQVHLPDPARDRDAAIRAAETLEELYEGGVRRGLRV